MTGFASKRIMSMGRQMGKSWATQAYKRLMDDLQNKPVEALICDEGKVYGARYYTVEPVGGVWYEMETWCMDTFGTPGIHMWDSGSVDPAQRWYMNNRKFWFRNAKDRDWFILRWNS